MARSDASVLAACDRIEYAETAARYEYMNLAIGGRATGLTDAELSRVVRTFGVTTDLVHNASHDVH
jgi:rhamnulose-1-phosphate aldolase